MQSIRGRVRFILIVSLIGLLVIIGFSTYFFQEQTSISEKKEEVQQALVDSEEIKYLMTTTLIEQQEFFNEPSTDKEKPQQALSPMSKKKLKVMQRNTKVTKQLVNNLLPLRKKQILILKS
jgi:methyl-accepting chemotaxis protein